MKKHKPEPKQNGLFDGYKTMSLLDCHRAVGKLHRQAYAKAMAYDAAQKKATENATTATPLVEWPQCSVEGCSAKACPSGTGRCSKCDYDFTPVGQKPQPQSLAVA